MKHLVYASRSTVAMGTAELEDLLVTARDNNRRMGVTGLLIVHRDRFLQCLEGPTDAVDAIFARIRVDPRHRAVEVRLDEPVQGRSFASWDMACTAVNDSLWLGLSTAKWEATLLFAPEPASGFALLQRAWAARGERGVVP